MQSRILFTLLFALLVSGIYAQSNTGAIKGRVKDSTYKHVLSSATVAVYKAKDSTLLQFRIPDNFGEFMIDKLPLNDTLQVQITHVGYKTFKKEFIIQPANNPLDFYWIYMHQQEEDEKDVVVTTYAPVRMNGDTLEFNPRAFKMDENATAEDLMRRLPGFVIWSDGDITFNGKKISALFVDGKPFLGGTDVTVATQNLPKDALDKVQVYQQRDEKNPLDSTLMANLKLKEDKKMGYFGKAGGGYGTKERYAADAMLTGFNKKLQVSATAAANNINKIARNVDELIRYSSYKGEGTNIDYQPDFNMAGLNKPVTGGVKFQYDFIPDVDYWRTHRLNADYFIDHNNRLADRNTTTRTLLKPDSILTRRSQSSNANMYTNQNFNSVYKKRDKGYDLGVSARGSIRYNVSSGSSADEQERTGEGIVSNGQSQVQNKNLSKSGIFAAEFTKGQDYFYSERERQRIPTNFTLRYSLSITDDEGSGHNRSLYSFLKNPGANKEFDRVYDRISSRDQTHHLTASYPFLKELIFGRKRLGDIHIRLGGNFIFDNNDHINDVLDLDTASRQYKQNSYLTNKRHGGFRDLSPELTFSKLYTKSLTNRYHKTFSASLSARKQYYTKFHEASHTVQNFRYYYEKLLPQASVQYTNHQYGSYEARYSLDFQSNVNYPTLNQIAPLVDSSNLYYIPKGNTNILPEHNNKLALRYNIESRKPKNPAGFEFYADYTLVKDKISDSSFYDDAGRRIVYNVNVNDFENWHLGSNFKKAYSPNKNHTFELNCRYNIYRYISPQYVNRLLNVSKTFNHQIDLQLGYTFKDVVALKAQQLISFYNAVQNEGAEKFKSNNAFTRLAGTVQFPKNLTWSTNVTYNRSISGNRPAIEYTIWNASLTYRFLQGNRGEFKLAALDLLHQNKSVINRVDGNVQVFGYENVLQQYFMLSLAYYPRKFGKK